MSKHVVVFGAAGFIGAHVVHRLLQSNYRVSVVDSLTYAGNINKALALSQSLDTTLVKWYWHDLRAPLNDELIHKLFPVDVVLNLASESHVDRSITSPVSVVHNNVMLALHVLEFTRVAHPECSLLLSTDEVYGPSIAHDFKEWDRHLPSNPYAASKSFQEAAYISYWRTYDVPSVIASCHDSETNAFTPNGSKSVYDLKRGDTVWALDTRGYMIEDEIDEIMIYPDYEGEMVSIRSEKINACVTPTHRMYGSFERRTTYKHGREREYDKPTYCDAQSLINTTKRFRVPLVGHWEGRYDANYLLSWPYRNIKYLKSLKKRTSRLIPMSDIVRFLGWYISEGCGLYKDDYFKGVSIAGYALSQRREIAHTLARMCFCPCISQHCVKCHSVLLQTLAEECGKYCENKRIPKWVLELDCEFLRPLLDNLIKGDGTVYDKDYESFVYYTKSLILAEQVCELGMKLGYSTRICKRWTWNPRKTIKGMSYIVRFRQPTCDVTASHVRKQSYKGMVWCLKTKTGNFAVIRGGQIHFSGNSMNVYGPGQHSEKLIPKAIKSIIQGDSIPVHAAKSIEGWVPGSRKWIFAKDLADAIVFIQGLKPQLFPLYDRPSKYHVVGTVELNTCEVIEAIGRRLGRTPRYHFCEIGRPGHDLRYSLDGTKLLEAGWKPKYSFEQGLEETLEYFTVTV